MQEQLIARAIELLESGKVNRILGWKAGDFFYDLTPAVFSDSDSLRRDFRYNVFSGANLSKYLIKESRKPGKVAAFLKPCDTYSFQQLLKEHRILRENVYVIGVGCNGMCDMEEIRNAGISGVLSVQESGDQLILETLQGQKNMEKQDALAERCRVCKSTKLALYDELIGEDGEDHDDSRFAQVHALEAMTPDERYDFWRNELSRCIRCNACRNVCPACSCEKCVFDNPASGVENKAAATSFEENMFHIIRAFHVAGRCTDCGECSRVCPQHIPLHLLNRKLISDMNELYGPYMAGSDADTRPPVLDFRKDDPEPSIIYERGRQG